LKEVDHMMRVDSFLILALAAGAICSAPPVAAAEKDAALASGLRPGDNLFSFLCRGINGPHKDKPLCYI
jgi:hypothetical protein